MAVTPQPAETIQKTLKEGNQKTPEEDIGEILDTQRNSSDGSPDFNDRAVIWTEFYLFKS